MLHVFETKVLIETHRKRLVKFESVLIEFS